MSTIKIRNCIFAFRCTKRWEDLARTSKPGVKFCDDCSKEVHWCASDAELVRAVKHGRCIAIDVGSPSASGRSPRTRKPRRGGETTLLGVIMPRNIEGDDDFQK